jgi:hypothetical protein
MHANNLHSTLNSANKQSSLVFCLNLYIQLRVLNKYTIISTTIIIIINLKRTC